MNKYPGTYWNNKTRKWYARYSGKDGKQKHVPGSFATQAEAFKAREALAQPIRDEKKREAEEYGTDTLAAFIRKRYYRHLEATCRPNSVRVAQGPIEKWIIPYLGKQYLVKLSKSPQKVWAFLDELENMGVSNNRINTVKTHLKHIYKKAYEWALVDKNPVRAPDRKVEKKEYRPRLSEEEVSYICGVFCNAFTQTVIYIAAYLGLRRNEIFGLRWSDFDFNRYRLHVGHQAPVNYDFSLGKRLGQVSYTGDTWERPTKTKAGRRSVVFAMFPRIKEVLGQWKEFSSSRVNMRKLFPHSSLFQHNDLVFPSMTRENVPYNPSSFSKLHWYPIRDKIREEIDTKDIEIFRFHDFRGTALGFWMRKGVPTVVCAKMGGWDDIDTMMKVYRIVGEEDYQLLEKHFALPESEDDWMGLPE